MEWLIVLVTLLAISDADITTDSTTTIFQSHQEILPDFSLTTNSGAYEGSSSVTPASYTVETDDTSVTTTATNLETIAFEPEESVKVEVFEIPAVTSRVSEITEQFTTEQQSYESTTEQQSYESTTEDAFVNVKETTVSNINKEVFPTVNYLDSSTKVTTLNVVANVSPSKPTPASTLSTRTPKSTTSSVIAETTHKFSVQPVTTSALPLQTQTPQLLSTSAVTIVATEDSNATITNQENIMKSDGSYKYGFNTSNGISVQAEGVSRNYNSTYNASDVNNNKPTRNIVVSGGFSWSDPNGKKISIKYTADETGYHPEGDAIPTPPPIPPQIAKALAWIRKVLAEKKEKELKESQQNS